MSSPELPQDLLFTILSIQKELKGSDMEKVKVAQEAYREEKNVDSDGEQSIPYFNWKIFTQI